VSLVSYNNFNSSREAFLAISGIIDCRISEELSNFLSKYLVFGDLLGVSDMRFGETIKEKCNFFSCFGDIIIKLMRNLRLNLNSWFPRISYIHRHITHGLFLTLSQYRICSSFDQIEHTVVHATGLLCDLNKEINSYGMQIREWYGWHFPEMTQLISDDICYAKIVQIVGSKENLANSNFRAVLPNNIVIVLKEAASISKGINLTDATVVVVQELCRQVLVLSYYQSQLSKYLKASMQSFVPNLTALVGIGVGAKLIAKSGSLHNLTRYPASTVQILGSEKAFFRALKTGRKTPKHGFLYQVPIVGYTTPQNRGKISRVLASKCCLVTRLDALKKNSTADFGIESRRKVITRLRHLESFCSGNGF
jgi:nucleolar protein 58